jgi:hypothetical protein
LEGEIHSRAEALALAKSLLDAAVKPA